MSLGQVSHHVGLRGGGVLRLSYDVSPVSLSAVYSFQGLVVFSCILD